MVALWLQLTKLTTTCEIALSFLLLQLADVDLSDVVMQLSLQDLLKPRFWLHCDLLN